jgi:predicted Zn-dependent protease
MKRLLACVALLSATSCAGLDSGSWLISEEQERQLGAEFHAQLLSQEMPEYQGNAAIGAYVRAVGNKLVAKSHRPNLPFTFTVVQSDEINAFAVLGGYVYVTTGLMKTATSGAEVASVLAHEIGHVTARHGVRQMETYMIEQGLLSLLDLGQWTDIVGGALQTAETLTFSKDQERESDELGVGYAQAAGYNPWGMVDFFTALQGLEGQSGGGFLSEVGELFSTHPPTAERIQSVEGQLGSMGIGRDTAGLTWDTDSYQDLVQGL